MTAEDDLGILRKMPIIELVMLIVRSRYEKYMPARKKAIISQAGQKYGLLESEGVTSKYFALLNDDAEKLARELTGTTKPIAGECPCGCRRLLRGKARYASQACQKKVWRRTQGSTESQSCTS